MKFKKTCIECGARVEKVVEGLCEDCYIASHPPIKDVKPLKLKVCNQTKEIAYNGFYYPKEEIEQMLPNMMKKQVEIDPQFELKDLWIEHFAIKGTKVKFDLCVDCDLKL